MTCWPVYDGPRDFPDKVVARLCLVVRTAAGTELRFARDAIVGDSLEEVRGALPRGLVRRPPQPGEDPVIVETWI